jgi:hypothetical protein
LLFVADACGDLDVQYVEVAVHELIDRGAGARVALLVDLPDEARAYLFASANARGPAGIVSMR